MPNSLSDTAPLTPRRLWALMLSKVPSSLKVPLAAMVPSWAGPGAIV